MFFHPAAASSGVYRLIKLVSALVLVYVGFGLVGAVASLAITPFAVLAFMGFYFRKYRKDLSKKAEKVKSYISLRKPFLLILATNMLLMVFLYLDLFFVKYYLGSEEAGFYNVANITAKVLMFAVGGITMVFLPKSSKLDIKSDGVHIKDLLLKSIMLMLPIFAAFLLFPELIISTFYTAKYVSALMPFRILTIGMFAYALFTILLNIFWSQNKETPPFLVSLTVLPADIVLLFYLVPAYGMTGAAIATTLSSVALLAFNGFFMRKMFKP